MAYRCFKHTTGNDDPFGIKLRYQCWRTGNGDIEPHSKRFPTLAPMAQKSWKVMRGHSDTDCMLKTYSVLCEGRGKDNVDLS